MGVFCAMAVIETSPTNTRFITWHEKFFPRSMLSRI